MKHFLFILFAIVLIPFTSQADVCVIDNNNDANGNVPLSGFQVIGQQFIACEAGTIQSIEIQIDFDNTTTATTTGNLNLFLVKGNGSTINSGSPFQVFTGIADGAITLTLTPGSFSVEKGEMYALAVGGTDIDEITIDMSPVGGPANPNLPDGLFLFGINASGSFQEQMPSDLFFAVNIAFTPIVIIPEQPIPSLSEWGLIIFGLLLLNLSVMGIYKKEKLLLGNV